MESIELGQKVRDRVTGMEGIAIGITTWLYGCRRVTVQPQELKEGKPVESYTIDEPQCEIVDARSILAPDQKTPETARRGGPRPEPERRQSAARR